MKKLIIFVGLISLQPMAAAQTCAPASKEMAQYFSQSTWRQHSVEGPQGVEPVHGHLDEKNNFYLNDLSRGGTAPAKITVKASNKNFFNYCRAGKLAYLRSMRRSREGNSYRVSIRYLPELTGFANDPLKTQNYKENNAEVRIKFQPDSAPDKLESYPDRLKAEVYALLNKQLLQQKTFGWVELDLTGWDDVMCDIVMGKTHLYISRSGLSQASVVVMKKEIEPSDVQLTYRALREQVPPSMSKEKAIFAASRAIVKLEHERRIGDWGDKRGFEVLAKLMNSDMSKIEDVDGQGLSCLVNQMQSYTRSLVQHFVNVQFKPLSLDAIEAEALAAERQ